MNKYGLIFISGLFLINTVVHSAERDDSSIFVLEAGAHGGGDTLAYTTDGEDSIEAGSGLSLGFGVRFNISDELETVVTYGAKVDALSTPSANVTFSRNLLNALVLFKSNDWHYGAGLTYHYGVEYEVESFGGIGTVEFKNALGFIADFRYFFSEGGYVGGRYTNIEYEVEATGQTFDGSSIGIVVGVYL